MDKNQNKEIEEKWYKFWEEKGFFKADPSSEKNPYSLLMPPPNLTGELHLGHAMQHAIMDAIARFKRMENYNVLLLPGVDHAGIQFEGTLDRILAKEDLSKRKLGREEWLKRAWAFKDEMYKSFHNTWKVMGISADWSREVFTLEPKVQKAVFEEFKTFWDQGLLYKGAYIVQWCPKCGTAIEDLEMEYQEKKEKLYFVKYQIENTDEFVVIATARPETIYADTGIAVYPNHSKFKNFVGKNAINPLTGIKIPVFEDNRVDKEFGTGALKITPGHDPLDFEIGKEHNLPILHALDKTGRMSSLTKELEGLKIAEARVKAEEKLNELGTIEKIEEFAHSVPVCERCKTTVEPLISEEWFVKMKPLAEKALKHIDEINFLPKNYQKIITDWLKEIHDWSISRSLWWGHRIPVWYCQKCNQNRKVGKDECMVISIEKPTSCKNCDCKGCECSEGDWVQDEQVLDTWFSSGLWPMSTLGWPSYAKASEGKPDENKSAGFEDNLGKYFPWDFEITAPEIKFLWIARMVMLSLWFKDNIPFKNMFFHGMLRDMQGRKFSKSLGNGIDPLDLINQWGVDATRMALYTYAIPGREGRLSKQIIDERCKNFRNFITKLKNINRFVLELKPEKSKEKMDISNKEDKEIMEKLKMVTEEVTKHVDKFELHLAVEVLYEFIWHDFADHYLESSKTRREEAQPVLEHILFNTLKLLHPLIPFTTEELYQKFPSHKESIMLESWLNKK